MRWGFVLGIPPDQQCAGATSGAPHSPAPHLIGALSIPNTTTRAPTRALTAVVQTRTVHERPWEAAGDGRRAFLGYIPMRFSGVSALLDPKFRPNFAEKSPEPKPRGGNAAEMAVSKTMAPVWILCLKFAQRLHGLMRVPRATTALKLFVRYVTPRSTSVYDTCLDLCVVQLKPSIPRSRRRVRVHTYLGIIRYVALFSVPRMVERIFIDFRKKFTSAARLRVCHILI